ncbi:MAG: hypothetical protein U0800_07775 [Isosphaeraceae bacterium]
MGGELRKLRGNANAIGPALLLALGFDHPDFAAYLKGSLGEGRLSSIASSVGFGSVRGAFSEWGLIF